MVEGRKVRFLRSSALLFPDRTGGQNLTRWIRALRMIYNNGITKTKHHTSFTISGENPSSVSFLFTQTGVTGCFAGSGMPEKDFIQPVFSEN